VFGNDCINNNFGSVASTLTFVDNARNNLFTNTITGVDFTLATHVYAAYTCTVFIDSGLSQKLSYIDGAGVLTIVNANA
jgi:hypothetical protein